MPYDWVKPLPKAPDDPGAFSCKAGGEVLAQLHIWPHRSLTPNGFVWFIGLTSAMISLPLIGLIGTQALWGLLPFLIAAIAAIWWALRRNGRDGTLTEELTLWYDRIELIRKDPKGGYKTWEANPYWVDVGWHEEGGPVEKYLTLKGGGREVELGAFLSPEERVLLKAEVSDAIAYARALSGRGAAI